MSLLPTSYVVPSSTRPANTILDFLDDKDFYLDGENYEDLTAKKEIIQSLFTERVQFLGGSASPFLHWTQRPRALVRNIETAFDKIKDHPASSWGYFNGSRGYNMCGVNDYSLIKKIILQAPKSQKEFVFLDIGAGNFQWGEGLAEFIEKQADLPKDIKVHIIGVRGEKNLEQEIHEKGRCKIYNFGSFKIEELSEEFIKHKLNLTNKVDLAISRWSFRHFADPAGTFAQTYNLLRPKTGFFFVDGFFLSCGNESLLGIGAFKNITQLFIDTKAPFLTKDNRDLRALNNFMLQRPDAAPCRLPMAYKGYTYAGDGWQIGSDCITQFMREPQETDEDFVIPGGLYGDPNLYGDKRLYDWLKKNELLNSPETLWKPLQAKDRRPEFPPLHTAVMDHDLSKIKECLARGDDIDESDAHGNAALHWAIQKGFYDLFTFLLSQHAHAGLTNGESLTPLHLAARLDTVGRFLQALIDAGAKMDSSDYLSFTPLRAAIQAKNLKAIEILIKAGAQISDKDYKELEGDPVFESLFENGIIPERPKQGLAAVYNWIKKGHCVVLHYNGSHGIQYYYPKASRKEPELMIVDINPETDLLGEGEWPEFLKGDGFDFAPYNEEFVKKINFSKINQFQFGY